MLEFKVDSTRQLSTVENAQFQSKIVRGEYGYSKERKKERRDKLKAGACMRTITQLSSRLFRALHVGQFRAAAQKSPASSIRQLIASYKVIIKTMFVPCGVDWGDDERNGR